MGSERNERFKSDKESENFNSEILKSAPLGLHQYIYINEKLIFSDFNKEADRILGVSHQDFLGKELQEIFPPLAETEIPEAYVKVATTGTMFQTEQVNYQYQQIIGAYQVFAFQPEKNKVTIFFRDITEIKKAEKKIKERENKYRSLFNTLAQGVIYLNNNGIIISINPAASRILKINDDAVIGKSFIDLNLSFINEELTPYLAAEHPCQKTLKTGNALNNIVLGIKFNETNEQIWLQMDTIPQPTEDEEEIPGILCVFTDITERKNAEIELHLRNDELRATEEELKATNDELKDLNDILENNNAILKNTYEQLRESEEKFRQLAENTGDFFWVRDKEKFIYLNPAFEKVWNRKKEQVLNDPFVLREWIHPDDVDKIYILTPFDLLEKENQYTEQYRIVMPDGEIKWIWVRVFPVYNQQGKIYRVAGIGSDITAHKKIENELIKAKEKAQESDRLKSSFLANISHEIRTPLNGIIGFSELLCDDISSINQIAQYKNIINQSAQQLLHIIDDIVDISKLTANQINIVKSPVDLNTLLRELYQFYNHMLLENQRSNISFSVKTGLGDKHAFIMTDQSRLRQVLGNLIDNSIKYTEKGFIKFGYRQTDTNQLEFFVKDTGIGIQPEMFDIIFERFRQVNEGHTRMYGGTGLGLPISKGIVELMGGKIWVESTYGEGTTFFFRIPYEEVENKIKTNLIDRIMPKDYIWKDNLILVVEDDDLNFEFIRTILEPTHAKIIHVADGEEALEICSEKTFDIILLDIRLPKINGYEIARILRERGCKTPIIAQTAYAMSEDRNKCIAAGCNDYISKPLNKNSMLEKIHELLLEKNKFSWY